MPYTFIDLFAGAGGLSEGFSARDDFENIAHVEMNSEACGTLVTRDSYFYFLRQKNLEPYWQYVQGKLTRDVFLKQVPQNVIDKTICTTMTSENIGEVIATLDKKLLGRRLDVLLGGPPCQAYSLVGRARTGYFKNSRDPRNKLYLLYLKVLEHFLPSVFVFENVRGLLSTSKKHYFLDMKKRFAKLGYNVEVNEVNSHDYGVLQKRMRLIIIGTKQNSSIPNIDLENQKVDAKLMRRYFVSDVLNDLPPLKPGQKKTEYIAEPSQYLLHFELRKSDDVLSWHVTRPIRKKDRAIYSRVIKEWNEQHTHLMYSKLPKNLKTHHNQTDFLDRFKIVPGDSNYSQTVVAHLAKDGHYYIHPDIAQKRSVSVREAARLQSFPDNFFFEGGRTAAFTQIGNAVPPLVSKAIAAGVAISLGEAGDGQNR